MSAAVLCRHKYRPPEVPGDIESQPVADTLEGALEGAAHLSPSGKKGHVSLSASSSFSGSLTFKTRRHECLPYYKPQ